MIQASKGNTTARFTDGVWATGIPQKAGWVAENKDQSSKIIPRQIVDLSNAQKERIVRTVEPIVPGVTVIPEAEIVPVKKKVVVTPAAKEKGNGNRKQKKQIKA